LCTLLRGAAEAQAEELSVHPVYPGVFGRANILPGLPRDLRVPPATGDRRFSAENPHKKKDTGKTPVLFFLSDFSLRVVLRRVYAEKLAALLGYIHIIAPEKKTFVK
jgi:hypothetical protein